ncbi:MAG: cyanoexosortase A system-associated protein [Leptolyngbyaceae cyanobacterium CAN_BIN12]|nr:cyanoexosortase A system-associated protein [Leptolyngbyaceae cyanobacterium CAN_BIN12]
MLNLNWQPARISLLAITIGGALLVLGKLLTLPKVDKTATQLVNTLETTVPLSGWQLLNNSELKANNDSRFGRSYRFQQGKNTLNADVHYMTSDGNISRYLFVYSPVRTANANLKIKYQPETGFYGVLSDKGQAYLTACVNPRGQSTVTEQQFTQSRYTYDLKPNRILPWVLGKESLIDRRCLWTLLSTPVQANSTPEASEAAAYKMLETAWLSWHQWWQANYPPA